MNMKPRIALIFCILSSVFAQSVYAGAEARLEVRSKRWESIFFPHPTESDSFVLAVATLKDQQERDSKESEQKYKASVFDATLLSEEELSPIIYFMEKRHKRNFDLEVTFYSPESPLPEIDSQIFHCASLLLGQHGKDAQLRALEQSKGIRFFTSPDFNLVRLRSALHTLYRISGKKYNESPAHIKCSLGHVKRFLKIYRNSLLPRMLKARDFNISDLPEIDRLGNLDPLSGFGNGQKTIDIAEEYKCIVIDRSDEVGISGFLSYRLSNKILYIKHLVAMNFVERASLLHRALERWEIDGISFVSCSAIFDVDYEMRQLFELFGFKPCEPFKEPTKLRGINRQKLIQRIKWNKIDLASHEIVTFALDFRISQHNDPLGLGKILKCIC